MKRVTHHVAFILDEPYLFLMNGNEPLALYPGLPGFPFDEAEALAKEIGDDDLEPPRYCFVARRTIDGPSVEWAYFSEGEAWVDCRPPLVFQRTDSFVESKKEP